MSEYQPKTGQKCHCRPGVWRDNCPDCEGTGWRIDFKAIRDRSVKLNAQVSAWEKSVEDNPPKRIY